MIWISYEQGNNGSNKIEAEAFLKALGIAYMPMKGAAPEGWIYHQIRCRNVETTDLTIARLLENPSSGENPLLAIKAINALEGGTKITFDHWRINQPENCVAPRDRMDIGLGRIVRVRVVAVADV